VTLEDLINSRDYPGCLEEALYGDVSDSDDFAKRTNRAAKTVLRRLLFTLSQLHDIGVVHRDVKPANLVLADTESAFKLVDFGAAADLRTGVQLRAGARSAGPVLLPPRKLHHAGTDTRAAAAAAHRRVVFAARLGGVPARPLRLVQRRAGVPADVRPAAARQEGDGPERRVPPEPGGTPTTTCASGAKSSSRRDGTSPRSTSAEDSGGTWRAAWCASGTRCSGED